MSYSLGVDLGTSHTAAAVARDGQTRIVSLGNQSATVPSVVLLKEDQTILTGVAADRRSLTEPDRVAREFKRRVGDTTPIFLGGAPHSAEALMAKLLRWVADEVATREGGPADQLTICHPANWGQYKKDLLQQAVRIAEVGSATFITEPEAAAIHYASNERVEPGSIIAVYDLGGGTFDAAILRKTDDGFEIMGKPEGIERLGGIDFDAAVFAHVARSLGGTLNELNEDDPAALAAVARLKAECTLAKEALSSDTDVSIQVLLPNVQTDLRLTRAEFESMIRPSLTDSIAALRRALVSAKIAPADLSAVLLAGGSSRIPLVSQIVGAELGVPVAVDSHPKHSVALGAALAGASRASGAVTDAAIAGAAVAMPDATAIPVVTPTETMPVMPAPTAPMPAAAVTASGSGRGISGKLIAAIAAAVVILGAGAFVLLSGGGDDSSASGATTPTEVETSLAPDTTIEVTPETTVGEAEVAPEITAAPTTFPVPDSNQVSAAVQQAATDTFSSVVVKFPTERSIAIFGRAFDESARQSIVSAASVPGMDSVSDQMELQQPDEQCTDTIRSQPRWACVLSASFDGQTIIADYVGSPQNSGAAWSLSSFHLHVFGSNIDPLTAGAAGPVSNGTGAWQVWDDPTRYEGAPADVGSPDGVPEKLCARVATAGHTLESLDSGNCWPVTE
ncbi:MAG: molecular chaperone DnaK [Ilumatobacter sp.]|jgi:molecular chaperone DnaK